jgi:uridine kinase
VIAIAGGSGAGKSTLAHAVAARLGAVAQVIAEDDYYFCSSRVADFDPATFDFDHPSAKDFDLLGGHLQALRTGQAIAKPRYDFTHHRRLDAIEIVHPAPVLIVEGICAFGASQVSAAADLRVLLDAPGDVRLARRLLRDMAERGRTPQSVVAQYFATVRPNHERLIDLQRARADLVLSVTPDTDIAAFADQVLTALPALAQLSAHRIQAG